MKDLIPEQVPRRKTWIGFQLYGAAEDPQMKTRHREAEVNPKR